METNVIQDRDQSFPHRRELAEPASRSRAGPLRDETQNAHGSRTLRCDLHVTKGPSSRDSSHGLQPCYDVIYRVI